MTESFYRVLLLLVSALMAGTVYALMLGGLLAFFPEMLAGRAMFLALVPFLIGGFVYLVKPSKTGGK